MTINLTKLRQLCFNLEEEAKKLAAYNQDLDTLLREMESAWHDDSRFPQYQGNIKKVIAFNDETIGELKAIHQKAYSLLVKLAKRLKN